MGDHIGFLVSIKGMELEIEDLSILQALEGLAIVFVLGWHFVKKQPVQQRTKCL